MKIRSASADVGRGGSNAKRKKEKSALTAIVN
jgi:hypothetical protein